LQLYKDSYHSTLQGRKRNLNPFNLLLAHRRCLTYAFFERDCFPLMQLLFEESTESPEKLTGEKSMKMSFFDCVPGPDLAHTA